MLQQTQVERVIPFYKKFLQEFPDAQTLARVPLSKVLKAWSGLGYNRRAKYLHEAAKIIARDFGGIFPKKAEELEKLPGVGPYTARAVAAFAYNVPEIFIETNIRTVFIHFCFAHKKQVSDKEILPRVAEALKKSNMPPRDFYAALMDYGAHLKKQGIKLNTKSKHYIKQSKFEGSSRQLRGAILRELLKSPKTLEHLSKTISQEQKEIKHELVKLQKEKLITFRNKKFSVLD